MVEIKFVLQVASAEKWYRFKELLPSSMMTWAGEEDKCISFFVWCST